METRRGNSAMWVLVLLAIFLLAFQGRVGLLAVVLPISLFLACAMACSGNHPAKLTGKAEKR
ncbi:MAG: hypothetical protein ACRD3L_08560 [Terriglobales bacterium]